MNGGPPRKMVVILHADIVGSTSLVQMDESLAHQRIQSAFQRLSKTIEAYGGTSHELRGDALLAEFSRASDAVCAAVAFQIENSSYNAALGDAIRPEARVGISLGEVVIADGTLTGAGVVLAQRLEQLAEPNEVVIQGIVSEIVPTRFPFEFESLGNQSLKGFDQPVAAIAARLKPGEAVPKPESRFPGGEPKGASKHGTETQPPPELPDRPSIVVLPFRNLSDDPDQDYFSDGITEDIIIELSRFPTLFVIARHSSFSLKEQKADIRDVARRLGVKYVAAGSVRKAAGRVRISVELVEAASRKEIWANRYDRSLDDIFAVQDEVVRTIVSALSGRVTSVEQKEAERKPTSSLTAYDYFLRGNSHFYRLTREDNLEARKMFQMAIASDPTFARAHARIAATHNIDAFQGLASSDSEALAKESIETALKLDPEDSWVRETLGFTLLREKNFEEAIRTSVGAQSQ